MSQLSAALIVCATLSVTTGLAHAGACALVMQDGQLLGLLTSENLSQFLLLRSVGLQPVEG